MNRGTGDHYIVTIGGKDSTSKGHYIEPIWDRQDPDGSHVGPMNFAISVGLSSVSRRYNLGIIHSSTTNSFINTIQ